MISIRMLHSWRIGRLEIFWRWGYLQICWHTDWRWWEQRQKFEYMRMHPILTVGK